jgi:hypothetical protein
MQGLQPSSRLDNCNNCSILRRTFVRLRSLCMKSLNVLRYIFPLCRYDKVCPMRFHLNGILVCICILGHHGHPPKFVRHYTGDNCMLDELTYKYE